MLEESDVFVHKRYKGDISVGQRWVKLELFFSSISIFVLFVKGCLRER